MIYAKVQEAIAAAIWKGEAMSNPDEFERRTVEAFQNLYPKVRNTYIDMAEVVMDDAIPVILEPLTSSLPKGFSEYESAKPWDKPAVAGSLVQQLVDIAMPIASKIEAQMEGEAA